MGIIWIPIIASLMSFASPACSEKGAAKSIARVAVNSSKVQQRPLRELKGLESNILPLDIDAAYFLESSAIRVSFTLPAAAKMEFDIGSASDSAAHHYNEGVLSAGRHEVWLHVSPVGRRPWYLRVTGSNNEAFQRQYIIVD